MKTTKILKIITYLISINAFFYGCSSTLTTSEEPLTYQVFYDNLSPYGTWIDYPGYGHVWNPNLNHDFSPYVTNGHWQATTVGWTWVSGYRWGWAPFHYGRWYYDPHFGWLWIPGYEWSPAWVIWGSVDNYYCWASLMPGVDISVQFDSWSPALFYWNFCRRSNITNSNLHFNVIRGNRFRAGSTILPIQNFQTTPGHHLYYATGPSFEEVQRETKTKINPVPIETISRAPNHSSKNRMRVYSPNIETPEKQQRRVSKPIPSTYRNALTQPRIIPHPAKDIQRKTQRENIRSLPQEPSTKRR